MISSNAEQLHVYGIEAASTGIVVSDYELGSERRRIWRRAKAVELMSSETDVSRQQQYSDVIQDLEDRNVWDLADWKKKVKASTGMTPRAFDDALRTVLTLRKLEDYVRSTVSVSEKEVFDQFVSDFSKRSGSWVALEATEELTNQVRESVKDEDITTHFEANRLSFRKGLSITCDYLRVPREHFAKETEANLAEDALRLAYERNKSKYLKKTPSALTGSFELLSEAEMAAKDAETYQSFDEVKDQVQEEYVKEQAIVATRAAANQIQDLLHPKEGQGATFEDITSSYPYVEVATVKPVEQDGAEEAFGDAYANVISSWFRTAATDGDLSSSQRSALDRKISVGEQGFVFFRNVSLVDPRTPELADVRDEVIDELAAQKVMDLLEEAAKAKAEAIDKGDVKLEELVETEIDIEVAEGVTAKAKFGTAFDTDGSLRQNDFIEIPDEESEEEDATKRHPSSKPILDGIFAIEDVGKANAVRDDENDVCFVLTFSKLVKPDSAGFEDKKDSVRGRLQRDAEDKRIQDWRVDVARRAYGEAAPIEADESDESDATTSS